MMRQQIPLKNLPLIWQEDSNFWVLVSLTDKNESTVPRYSQWQLQKISKPLVKKNGFNYKFETKVNLKFA